MKKRPARVSLRGDGACFAVSAEGDLYWVGTNMNGVFRHRWADGKTDRIAEQGCRQLAVVGDDRFAVGAHTHAGVVQRATGRVVATLKPKKKIEGIRELAASPDGALVAISHGHLNASHSGIEIFESGGKHVQSIDLGRDGDLAVTTLGMIFSEDSKSLVYFVEGSMRTLAVGKKTPVTKRASVPFTMSTPVISHSGSNLLVHAVGVPHEHTAIIVSEKTGKTVKRLGDVHAASWGTSSETMITVTDDRVSIVDMKGHGLVTFERPKKPAACVTTTPLGWIVVGSSSSIELYDSSRIGELSKTA